MRVADTLRFSLVLVAGATTGCAPSLFSFSTTGYDAHACVEDAIARKTDPALAARAAGAFEDACVEGDAASCSALGALFETGQGRPKSVAQAGVHYARACAGDNQRGCVNLARLEASGALGEVPMTTVRRRLATACEDGEQTGCAELGRRLAHGDGVPRDAKRGRRLLENACSAGRAEACFELGDLDTAPGTKPNLMSLELFVSACVAGHRAACDKLDGNTRIASAR